METITIMKTTKKTKPALETISLFNFKDVEINLLFRNGLLGYTFEKDGKFYGQKVELTSKSVQGIASATFLLFQNAIETLEAVEKLND